MSGLLALTVPGCGSSGDEPIDEPVASKGPDGEPVSLPSFEGDPTLDLDGMPEASVPPALTHYVQHVASAVADDVGPELYVGSQIDLPDTPDVAVTIFGTDVQRLSDALDRLATQQRDRFTVVASEYSFSELEQFVTDADARLADAGIEATAWVGMGYIDVLVVTPEGQSDPELESAVGVALGDLPFEIEFVSPMLPLDS